MHPVPPSVPALDDVSAGQIILRDGTVAGIRRSGLIDVPDLQRFFHDLSEESRYRRFFTRGDAPADVVRRLSDSRDPARGVTLVAERSVDGASRIVATASYSALKGASAEVAFAVADDFQGKGLGTLLLERLAAIGAQAGLRRFEATTLADNTQMLSVFRDSGFEIRSKSAGGSVIDVQLSLASSAARVAAEEDRRRRATVASLRPLLEPSHVAVIGASRNPSNLGRRVLQALQSAGFKGPLYPVNPQAGEIGGLKVYTSALELPRGVDLAVVAVPARAVLEVVDDCAAAGIKSLVILTAGFAEVDEQGRALQDQLTAKVRSYGMRLVGPNCMGLLNTHPGISLNASFSPTYPPRGHFGLLSQSGALGLSILQLATDRQLGLSTFVSVGNKADVSGNDLLEYREGDPSTTVILLYLESFGNPRRFARLARRVGQHKPIIVVKSGRTKAGSRAASSHTAALAASDAATDALFHQTGVIRTDTIDEMFDVAACLDNQPLPTGRRIAIVTNAGGPGILAADACDAAGLTVVDLSGETRERLRAILPATASRGNPVDMIASAGEAEYRDSIEAILRAPEVDSLLVIFTPVDQERAPGILRAIRDGVAAGRREAAKAKPVLACVMATPGRPMPIEGSDEHLPTYAFPENAVRALGKVTTHAEWRRQPPGLFWGFDDAHVDDVRHVCQAAVAREGDAAWLRHDEVDRVLGDFGLPIVPSAVARTADEAAALAAVMGFPVVAKISSSRVQHKTDVGGVKVNLADAQAVRTAFTSIRNAAGEPTDADVLIQPMIAGGIETMMGIVQDPAFGPLVAFGLGGINVELLGDVHFRIAPLTDRDVDELLRGIRGYQLLLGYRGHPPADLDALREVLLRLSHLTNEVPEIAELDLNPVIALPPGQGCRIVDARIRVRSAG